MNNLLIRADAGLQIGTGHVMRCLALAQAWTEFGGQVAFLTASGSDPLLPRLHSEGVEITSLPVEPGCGEDAHATAALAQKKEAKWVVVDGYVFDAVYQKVIRDAGLLLLFVDDNGNAAHYFADIVLNQNLHACENLYASRERHTKLMLGPRYALLRREFMKWRAREREIPQIATKILITLGGSDARNCTLEVLRSIARFAPPDWQVKAIVGPGCPHAASLRQEANQAIAKVEVLEGADMPECMAWADLTIAGAGSTAWELCFLGVPSVLIVIAENQRAIADELASSGIAISFGDGTQVAWRAFEQVLGELARNPQRRVEMSQRGRALVDGGGARRVATELCGAPVSLRRVEAGDCQLIWQWANDPEARSFSFSVAPIPWEEHLAWFKGKTSDPNCLFLVGSEREGNLVGQVRFELKNQCEAVVHISVAADQRGRGYGRTLLRHGLEELFWAGTARRVHAYIKPANQASVRAFEQSGFHSLGRERVRGQEALHYLLEAGHQD